MGQLFVLKMSEKCLRPITTWADIKSKITTVFVLQIVSVAIFLPALSTLQGGWMHGSTWVENLSFNMILGLAVTALALRIPEWIQTAKVLINRHMDRSFNPELQTPMINVIHSKQLRQKDLEALYTGPEIEIASKIGLLLVVVTVAIVFN